MSKDQLNNILIQISNIQNRFEEEDLIRLIDSVLHELRKEDIVNILRITAAYAGKVFVRFPSPHLVTIDETSRDNER